MSCQDCVENGSCIRLADNQPPIREFTIDGLFVKQIELKGIGTVVPQHAHKYAHTTFLALGEVAVVKEDGEKEIFHAPYPIYIEANKTHGFVTLTESVILLCIHNISRKGELEIVREHPLTKILGQEKR